MKRLGMGPGAPTRSAHATRGFTLLELVIVVSMMLVLLGIVVPSLQPSPSLQVQSVARLLAAHLEMARTQALADRVEVEVVFDESAGTYTAYMDDDRDGEIVQSKAEMDAFQRFGARSLEGRVAFGRGTATSVPGDPSTGAVTLTDNTLKLDVQGVPAPWGAMGTIYLVHRDDSHAVGAVTIVPSGSFKAWRWSQSAGEWR